MLRFESTTPTEKFYIFKMAADHCSQYARKLSCMLKCIVSLDCFNNIL